MQFYLVSGDFIVEFFERVSDILGRVLFAVQTDVAGKVFECATAFSAGEDARTPYSGLVIVRLPLYLRSLNTGRLTALVFRVLLVDKVTLDFVNAFLFKRTIMRIDLRGLSQ